MTRPDHQTAAATSLDDAANASTLEGQANHIAVAHVHATLALVEQQRIANIIAANDRDALIWPPLNANPYSSAYEQQKLDRDRFEARIAAEVTEAVGLA